MSDVRNERHPTVDRPPRLIASDVDGTLITSGGHLAPATVRAVARAEEAGARVVLVSGRPPRWMHEVADDLGHRGMAICSNGAVRYDLASERVVASQQIEPAVLRGIVDTMVGSIPEVTFAVEYGLERAYAPGYVPNWPEPHEGPEPLEDVLGKPAVKLLVRHPTMTPDDFLALGRDLLGERATVTHSSVEALLEISATGVTKASGLASYVAELSIAPADVVAFGDMPNDLPMFAWAGRSYAMANAHPDVRAAADEVIGSNDDDGVAAVLCRWFPE